MKNWTALDIPPQHGRQAVVTGSTGGLGYETAMALAGAGARVVVTGRDHAKGAAALAGIRAAHPQADVVYENLDLASLTSVYAFSERFCRESTVRDVLVNNGGIMGPPKRQETVDGFEAQLGTNYLSHFALTAQLLPTLRRSKCGRVVNLGSIAHRYGAAIHFDDLNWQRRYAAFEAYGQSKLAMVMFTLELQRRSDVRGWNLLSVAAHPGLARTSLLTNGLRLGRSRLAAWIDALQSRLPPQSLRPASDGAVPTLYAATAPNVDKGGYYGPTGFLEIVGPVGPATVAPAAQDSVDSARLWELSETLTGAHWP